MSTEIYDDFPGRGFSNYDLLDELVEKYGLDRREAHESIHAFLNQIVDIDGDGVILKREPVNPQLLVSNPRDLDIRHWLTISDSAANDIRNSFAAVYETD
ncbi:hypothetical protein ACFUJU_13390 [Streptomyces sp. NPDC057235]|uniref:hypothetical protein n=1 Tax=Streptomyces sp. NPDC057235 TaxID=3346058 RepID=UPI00362A8409